MSFVKFIQIYILQSQPTDQGYATHIRNKQTKMVRYGQNCELPCDPTQRQKTQHQQKYKTIKGMISIKSLTSKIESLISSNKDQTTKVYQLFNQGTSSALLQEISKKKYTKNEESLKGMEDLHEYLRQKLEQLKDLEDGLKVSLEREFKRLVNDIKNTMDVVYGGYKLVLKQEFDTLRELTRQQTLNIQAQLKRLQHQLHTSRQASKNSYLTKILNEAQISQILTIPKSDIIGYWTMFRLLSDTSLTQLQIDNSNRPIQAITIDAQKLKKINCHDLWHLVELLKKRRDKSSIFDQSQLSIASDQLNDDEELIEKKNEGMVDREEVVNGMEERTFQVENRVVGRLTGLLMKKPIQVKRNNSYSLLKEGLKEGNSVNLGGDSDENDDTREMCEFFKDKLMKSLIKSTRSQIQAQFERFNQKFKFKDFVEKNKKKQSQEQSTATMTQKIGVEKETQKIKERMPEKKAYDGLIAEEMVRRKRLDYDNQIEREQEQGYQKRSIQLKEQQVRQQQYMQQQYMEQQVRQQQVRQQQLRQQQLRQLYRQQQQLKQQQQVRQQQHRQQQMKQQQFRQQQFRQQQYRQQQFRQQQSQPQYPLHLTYPIPSPYMNTTFPNPSYYGPYNTPQHPYHQPNNSYSFDNGQYPSSSSPPLRREVMVPTGRSRSRQHVAEKSPKKGLGNVQSDNCSSDRGRKEVMGRGGNGQNRQNRQNRQNGQNRQNALIGRNMQNTKNDAGLMTCEEQLQQQSNQSEAPSELNYADETQPLTEQQKLRSQQQAKNQYQSYIQSMKKKQQTSKEEQPQQPVNHQQLIRKEQERLQMEREKSIYENYQKYLNQQEKQQKQKKDEKMGNGVRGQRQDSRGKEEEEDFKQFSNNRKHYFRDDGQEYEKDRPQYERDRPSTPGTFGHRNEQHLRVLQQWKRSKQPINHRQHFQQQPDLPYIQYDYDNPNQAENHGYGNDLRGLEGVSLEEQIRLMEEIERRKEEERGNMRGGNGRNAMERRFDREVYGEDNDGRDYERERREAYGQGEREQFGYDNSRKEKQVDDSLIQYALTESMTQAEKQKYRRENPNKLVNFLKPVGKFLTNTIGNAITNVILPNYIPRIEHKLQQSFDNTLVGFDEFLTGMSKKKETFSLESHFKYDINEIQQEAEFEFEDDNQVMKRAVPVNAHVPIRQGRMTIKDISDNSQQLHTSKQAFSIFVKVIQPVLLTFKNRDRRSNIPMTKLIVGDETGIGVLYMNYYYEVRAGCCLRLDNCRLHRYLNSYEINNFRNIGFDNIMPNNAIARVQTDNMLSLIRKISKDQLTYDVRPYFNSLLSDCVLQLLKNKTTILGQSLIRKPIIVTVCEVGFADRCVLGDYTGRIQADLSGAKDRLRLNISDTLLIRNAKIEVNRGQLLLVVDKTSTIIKADIHFKFSHDMAFIPEKVLRGNRL